MDDPGIRVIGNEWLELAVATGFGPRVVALTPKGGPNLFAELGDLGIDLVDGRRYLFRGGHRLWVAPEIPEVTYEPDEGDVLWSASGDSVSVARTTGRLEKTISAQLDGRAVDVTHRVTNLGTDPIELAPWAITQFPTGGTALLPLDRAAADTHGLQANHVVAGWPYTDWAALGYDDEAGVILVEGNRRSPTKVGTSLARGWLAYVRSGWVFAKFARPAPESPVDRGAQAEIYANAGFVELETLGALSKLGTGESATHREVWRIGRAPDSIGAVPAVVEGWQTTR
jgi:hypothetical protein